jgi:hypothetical protein
MKQKALRSLARKPLMSIKFKSLSDAMADQLDSNRFYRCAHHLSAARDLERK